MVLAERRLGTLVVASRLSDEEDDAEPLELDDLEEDLADEDDAGQLVVDDEEEDQPSAGGAGREEGEEDLGGGSNEGF